MTPTTTLHYVCLYKQNDEETVGQAASLKDKPVQYWLERCPWGILKSERYASFEVQQAQLANALKEG